MKTSKHRISTPLWSLITAGFFTLIIAAAIRIDLTEWLRGGFGWRWPYEPLALAQTLPLIILTVLYLIGAWWVLPRGGRAAVAWAVLGALALPVAAVAIREGDALAALFGRTVSELGTGPHWVAAHLDWENGALYNWADEITHFGGHLSNLPPGSVLWYGLLNHALDSAPTLSVPGQQALMPYQCHNYALLDYTPGQWTSTVFGMFMPLWAALAVFPLHAIARRLMPGRAATVVLWFPLIPALGAFAGSWNTLYPLAALLAFLALLIACDRPRFHIGWALLAGFISGLGWFTNFALVPLALLMGVWVLANEWWVKRRSFIQCVGLGAAYGVGLISVYAAFWLGTGQTPFDLLRAGMAFHLTLDRPYPFWVFMHVWDWLLWGGLAFVVVLVAGLVRWLRSGLQNRAALPVVGLTLTLTILILTISGTARGETGRVWLFFAPFLLLAAAEYFSSDEPTTPAVYRTSWAWLAIPQAALMVALASSVATITTALPPRPEPLQIAASRPANALFNAEDDAGIFRLVGWDASVRDGVLNLRLNWQGVEPSLRPVWFGGVLIGDGQTIVPLEPWQPGGESRYPTTCWVGGLTVGDTLTVDLGGVQADEWWLSLAAYGDPSQPEGRLQVHTDGTDDTQIGLGPIIPDE